MVRAGVRGATTGRGLRLYCCHGYGSRVPYQGADHEGLELAGDYFAPHQEAKDNGSDQSEVAAAISCGKKVGKNQDDDGGLAQVYRSEQGISGTASGPSAWGNDRGHGQNSWETIIFRLWRAFSGRTNPVTRDAP